MNVKKSQLKAIRRKRNQDRKAMLAVIAKMEAHMSEVFKRTELYALPSRLGQLLRWSALFGQGLPGAPQETSNFNPDDQR